MNRNTVLLAALVLLLLAGPLLWILTDEQSPPAPRGTNTAAPAPPRAAPTPSRGPLVPRAEPETTAAAPDVLVPAAPTTAKPPEPRAVVRVLLQGLDDEVPLARNTATVIRAADPNEGTDEDERFVADGGLTDRFDVDVTPLVREERKSVELTIDVDRPGYLPESAKTAITPPERKSGPPASADVAVRLRVAGWATGVVQDERFERVGGADVGAFVRAGKAWALVDAVVTDEEGLFRLRLRPGDANLVVVAAEGMEPASAQTTGVARAESGLTPFTLRPGLAISGSVRFADGRFVPDAGVAARPSWTETGLRLGSHWLSYEGGQILECPAGAGTENGLFRVAGLVPGDYDVWTAAPGVATDLAASLRRRISPPYEGLDLVIDGGRVLVTVSTDDGPVRHARVSIANEQGGVSVTTDAHGAASALVLPSATYDVAVAPRGFGPEKRAVVAPSAGQETRVEIRLRRLLRPPVLRLVLRPEDAEGDAAVASADLRAWFEDDDPPAELPDASGTVVFARGGATFGGLSAGTYRIDATPRPEAFRLAATARTTLREGAESRVELRFPHGGRLHVAAHDAAGAPVAATFRVLGADDAEAASGAANAAAEADPLLPAATYRVEVTPSKGTAVVETVKVVADAVRNVDVAVARAPKGE